MDISGDFVTFCLDKMATCKAAVHATITPLDGSNYTTWKLQCQMALMKDGLWDIVTGTTLRPARDEDAQAKFDMMRDKALAIIVLSIDTSLLYVVGEPVDPVAVWTLLKNQLQKKSWAKRLHLRKKLYALRLKEGGSVQEHIKVITEIFNSLSMMGDTITEVDCVVHLLASLPDSFSVLVMALEVNPEVPSMENVTERCCTTNKKNTDEPSTQDDAKAMVVRRQKVKGPKCYGYGKIGHMKRDCQVTKKKKQAKEVHGCRQGSLCAYQEMWK